MVPRFYGVSYRKYDLSGVAICYPIPLNLLVRLVRSIWHLLKIPSRTWWEREMMSSYTLGFERGRNQALLDAVVERRVKERMDTVAKVGEVFEHPPASP